MYFNDKFLSQTKYISLSHLHPKSLEYMVWNFCKQIIKVDNKYYNKGLSNTYTKYTIVYASCCM